MTLTSATLLSGQRNLSGVRRATPRRDAGTDAGSARSAPISGICDRDGAGVRRRRRLRWPSRKRRTPRPRSPLTPSLPCQAGGRQACFREGCGPCQRDGKPEAGREAKAGEACCQSRGEVSDSVPLPRARPLMVVASAVPMVARQGDAVADRDPADHGLLAGHAGGRRHAESGRHRRARLHPAGAPRFASGRAARGH